MRIDSTGVSLKPMYCTLFICTGQERLVDKLTLSTGTLEAEDQRVWTQLQVRVLVTRRDQGNTCNESPPMASLG